MSKTPEEVVADLRRLAEENDENGDTLAAEVQRDAANHVEEHLVEDGPGEQDNGDNHE